MKKTVGPWAAASIVQYQYFTKKTLSWSWSNRRKRKRMECTIGWPLEVTHQTRVCRRADGSGNWRCGTGWKRMDKAPFCKEEGNGWWAASSSIAAKPAQPGAPGAGAGSGAARGASAVGAASAVNAPVFGCPVFVISLTAERCRWFEQQLSADEVRCVRATKRSEIRLDPVNGSATYVGSDDDSGGGGGGDSGGGGGARVRWLSSDAHPMFRLGPLEIAILISHMRAVSAGRQRLAQGRERC